MITAQFNNLASIPNYPGTYIIARYTNFAFLAAYNEGADPTQALLGHIYTINKEITRKRAEFGLETLEQGETLADKRLGQAKAAAAELIARDPANEALADKIVAATKGEDPVTLKALSEEILAMLSAEEIKSCEEKVRITKGPDITDKEKINDTQLLYYVSVALMDAAEAIESY